MIVILLAGESVRKTLLVLTLALLGLFIVACTPRGMPDVLATSVCEPPCWQGIIPGETVAGIVKNTTRIPSLTETAAYRIPDQLIRSQNLLSEVKNVAYQTYTSQIKDYLLYAQQQGLKFELIVRQNTEFSKPLQVLIDAGKIVPQRYLPPQ